MKHVITDTNIKQELTQGMLELHHSAFDLSSHHDLTINSPSESGSITPETLKYEFECNNEFLKQLKEDNEAQKAKIIKMLKFYNFSAQYDEQSAKIIKIDKTKEESLNPLRRGVDLEQMKTTSEVKEINDKLNEERRTIVATSNDIILDNRSLSGMQKLLDSFDEKDYKDVITLKIYQEDGKSSSSNTHTEVKRFALIAENLTKLIKTPLNPNVLHPLEMVLFKNALLKLKNLVTKSGGVVCDIFVRGDNHQIGETNVTTTKGDKKVPETHSIVLWKEDNQIIMLDPSSDKFSSPLTKDIIRVAKTFNFEKVTSGIDGVLYGHDGKKVGRKDDNSRDCIDIAVKIVLEMTDQTNVSPKKDIKVKIKDTCAQLSTETKHANHFIKDSNKQVRELRSTSSKDRQLALKTIKNYILKGGK